MTFKRMYHSVRMLLSRGDYRKARYLKKHNLLGGMGDNCKWGPWLLPLYPELIVLHNNVCVHKTCHILTHDMIDAFLKRAMPDAGLVSGESLGPVEIGDNVYISMDAVIMPNVSIGNNCIISAGAVVTSDVPENSIVAGNPAKVVGRFDTYAAFRKMFNKNNPVFRNQYLPQEIAEEAWERFRKKHNRAKK